MNPAFSLIVTIFTSTASAASLNLAKPLPRHAETIVSTAGYTPVLGSGIAAAGPMPHISNSAPLIWIRRLRFIS